MASLTPLIALVIILLATISLVNSAPCVGIESGLLTWDTQNYCVFAGSGYTFAGGTASTTLTGDIGSYPTASPLSSNPKVTLVGSERLDTNLYTKVAAQDINSMHFNGFAKAHRMVAAPQLGGLTLTPGVYFGASSIGIATGLSLTLDGGGDEESVFVFVAGSTIITGAGSSVVLTGSAKACHVYWFAGSSVTTGVGSVFVGTVNAELSISVSNNTSITGRLFAGEAITIDSSDVTVPDCRPTLDELAYCGSATLSNSMATLLIAVSLVKTVFTNLDQLN